MTSAPDVPREALEIRYNNSGFLTHVELHRRGELFFQESSYSHFWFFAVMLTMAGVVSLLPWELRATVGKVKHWIAGGLLWGGICGLVPYFIRNAYGQIITIDPVNRTLTISSPNFRENLSWQQIVGLQVCFQKYSGDSEMDGFQLNLVWVEAGGAVKRHCLLKHSARALVVRLGQHYESLFGFPLIDHTGNSQPDGAANGSQPSQESVPDSDN